MPVLCTFTFVCEMCGKVESRANETSVGTDETVVEPFGRPWDYVTRPDVPGAEYLACPECVAKLSAAALAVQSDPLAREFNARWTDTNGSVPSTSDTKLRRQYEFALSWFRQGAVAASLHTALTKGDNDEVP